MSPLVKELIEIQTAKLAAKPEQKEKKYEPKSAVKPILGGLAVSTAGGVGNLLASQALKDSGRLGDGIWDKDPDLSPADEKLWKNMAEEAEGQGIHLKKQHAGQKYKHKGTGFKRQVNEQMADAIDPAGPHFGRAGEYMEAFNDRLGKRIRKGAPYVQFQNEAPDILAHELGHAKIDKSRLGRLLQNKLTTGLGQLSGVGGLGLGLTAGMKADDKRLQTAGALSGGLMMAPTLAYEGLATINGLRNLKRHGASKKQMRDSLKNLGAAWGTYGGKAVGNTGGSMFGFGLGRAIRNKSEAKKAKEQAKARKTTKA